MKIYPNYGPPAPAELSKLKIWDATQLELNDNYGDYLLLNAKIIKEAGETHCSFFTFLSSILYIGKRKGNRQLQHFKDTFKAIELETEMTEKESAIEELWNSEDGVIPLEVFPMITSNEALVHEACMLAALEPQMLQKSAAVQLANKRNGSFYDEVLEWSIDQKMKVGTYDLYSCYQIFLHQRQGALKFSNIPESNRVFFQP
uniref:GIY-YIG homing endonuclease n=1 Tax=Panagrolaimus sp. ES5 TaxID=591445 RepID=A0AC34F438_9BILA